MTRGRILLAAALGLALALPATPASAADPTIATVAGGIPSGLPGPSVSVKPGAMDHDSAGTLYVADTGQGVVWKIDQSSTIRHFAGTGRMCMPDPAACRAEGGSAKEAYLQAPAGLVVAPNGDVYVSEMRGHIVRRIDAATGLITTVAGTGETGYSSDHEGAAATDATLYLPQSLDMDSQGRLYIADIGNKRIRRVSTDGRITSIAGCGSQTFPSCFTFAKDGSPVASTPIGANAGINGNGWGIAISPQDELYFADVGQILKLDEQQQVYRVIMGKSFTYASFPGEGENGPAQDARISVAVELNFGPNGDLYLLEGGGSYDNPWNRIQRIEGPASPASIVRHVGGLGTGNGFAGDGSLATQARFAFSQPTGTWTGQGLSVGPDGGILVADVKNNRLRRIDGATKIVTTFAGNGYGGADYIFRTFNLTPYDGLVSGQTSRGGHSGDGRVATEAQLYFPVDVEMDRFGVMYVLEYGSHRVRKITPDGKISTVAGSGCVGEGCYAARINSPLGDGDLATKAQLFEPMGIALDRTGTQLFIAESGRARVRQVNMGSSTFTAYPLSTGPIEIKPGHIATVFGPGTGGCNLVKPYCGEGLPATQYAPSEVTGVATDASGNLYVSDEGVGNVVKADPATSIVTTVAGVPHATDCSGPADDGRGRAVRLCGPGDLEVAAGNLYITETGYPGFADSLTSGFQAASRIRKVSLTDPTNPTTTVAGNGSLGFDGDGGSGTSAMLALPHGVAVGPDGSVYIGDSGNHRVRRVAPNGTITTVAGSGLYGGSPSNHQGCGFGADGAAASDALLCDPMGLEVGPDGNLYVADAGNNLIRVIRGL